MKSDELTTASAVRNNISELLLYAIMNKHYDTADYLLGIYEDAAWYWNPKEDLSRPSSENSLLALALMFDQINMATRIVALQEGPYFNKTDRDLVVPIPDSEWNDPIKQQEKKPIAGFTLLHIMAQYNLATLIEPFIEQTGINPNEKTYYSKATPLIIAEIYDSNDAVKVLNEINAPANNDGTCERPAKKAKTEIS
jgi:ankyrin repeat protein